MRINENLARASALIGVKELKELSLRFAPLGVKPIPFSVYDKPTIGLTT